MSTGPSQLVSSTLMTSPATQLVKSPAAGCRTSSVSAANQFVAKSAGPVSYKLSVMAEIWTEDREDHLFSVFEEQLCLYDTRLQATFRQNQAFSIFPQCLNEAE